MSAMKKADWKVANDWAIDCPASREDGYRETVKVLSVSKAPTALLCFNDTIAFGAMLGLRSLGLEPGADCSIVGMADISEAALWQPGLTTFSIERASIGEAAGKLITAHRPRGGEGE